MTRLVQVLLDRLQPEDAVAQARGPRSVALQPVAGAVEA